MPTTVGASLKLFDQFTATLNRAETGIQSVITVAERLKHELQSQITLNIDMAGALAHIETVKERIRTMGGSSAINIIINESDVIAKITEIQNKIRTGLAGTAVNLAVHFDAVAARAQMTALIHSLGSMAGVQLVLGMPNTASIAIIRAQLHSLLSGLGLTGIIIDVRLNSAKVITQAANLRNRIIDTIGTIVVDLQIELPAAVHTVLTELTRLVKKLIEAIDRLHNGPGGGGGGGPGGSGGGSKGPGGLIGQLKGIAAAYLGIAAAKKAMEISDEYVSTQARLDLIKDSTHTVGQMQTEIFQAAKRARGSYEVMANSVGKMGLLAGEAFGNNKELIAFTELMQKSFKISGASTMEQQSGMYQLTQAMASGKLQGDEFRSIMENAPMLADAIAKFTGKSKGQLKEMSAAGTITADIIKGALFKASDDINAKFATMPRTFGDMAVGLKNKALEAFGPVIEKISKFMNSKSGTAIFDGLLSGISMASAAASKFVDIAIWVVGVMQDNWPIVRAILMSLALVISVVVVAALYEMAIATLEALWPVLLVIAAIALVIYIIQQFGVTTQQIIGAVIGYLYFVCAAWYNIFAVIWNTIASSAEFFGNVFTQPAFMVKNTFYHLAMVFLGFMADMSDGAEDFSKSIYLYIFEYVNKAIGVLNKMGGALNKFFDTDRFKEINPFNLDNVKGFSSSIRVIMGMLEKYKPEPEEELFRVQRMEFMNMFDAFNKGFASADDLMKGIDDILKGAPDFDMSSIKNIDNVGTVGKVKGKVDISSEDLKVMRELADIQNIQNFVSLTPTVQVTTGPINQPTDVSEIIRQIGDFMEQEVSNNAQRSYS
ncbi:tape measure protein [Paenibacillus sp. FSL H8-0034]|uniref:tape measure protein n=1 Tax=Paenibacillus sp. FSL H8-0034 TaxID=2954671 RepID=UPI0030F4F1A7